MSCVYVLHRGFELSQRVVTDRKSCDRTHVEHMPQQFVWKLAYKKRIWTILKFYHAIRPTLFSFFSYFHHETLTFKLLYISWLVATIIFMTLSTNLLQTFLNLCGTRNCCVAPMHDTNVNSRLKIKCRICASFNWLYLWEYIECTFWLSAVSSGVLLWWWFLLSDGSVSVNRLFEFSWFLELFVVPRYIVI